MHVTVRVRPGLPSLREEATFLCIRRQIGEAKRRFLRVVHFSVQSNHLHLLVEANDRALLGRGMKGLGVRVARHLNRLLCSRGNVWDGRYHARPLKTPREVRNALAYVLFNHRKHGRRATVDTRSSARFFEGWAPGERRSILDQWAPRQRAPAQNVGQPPLGEAPPVVAAETWLMSRGWKRNGLLRAGEHPAP